jgi:flagellar export protein FliJ
VAFHFQLEGLLRVHRLLEQQARERLDESMMRIRTLEHMIDEAIEWRQKTAALRISKEFLPAMELQFIESVLVRTTEAIAQCRNQKLAEEKRAAELRGTYLEKRRERKTVETLRENALRKFQTEQLRREQLNLDEMFLGKLLYARNSVHPDSAEIDPEKTNP